MSGKTPGAPSLAEAARMRANAQTGAVSTSKRYQWQLPAGSKGSSSEFPIVPVPKDPYDDVANVKAQYSQADAGSNWMVPFEQSDAEYLLRKRDAEEKAEFDAWVMQKYDITDPAQNLMLQNIAPELFQRREEVIDSQQALVSAYAKMRLRGAKSLSDLELEWLIETNRLQLPEGPIWNPSMWRNNQVAKYKHFENETDDQWQAQRYRFGLFSPLVWLTKGDAGWTRNKNNPADPFGNPAKHYLPDTVPYPNDPWANTWTTPVPYPYAGSNTHNFVNPGDTAGANAAGRLDSAGARYGRPRMQAHPGYTEPE